MDVPSLQWRSSYESGHAAIDGQHRHLFALGRKLVDEVAANRPVGALVEVLSRNLVAHFEAEERLLAEAGFPGTVEHAREHARIVRDVRQLGARMAENPTLSSDAVEKLVFGVIAAHVLGSDPMFFHYLRARA